MIIYITGDVFERGCGTYTALSQTTKGLSRRGVSTLIVGSGRGYKVKEYSKLRRAISFKKIFWKNLHFTLGLSDYLNSIVNKVRVVSMEGVWLYSNRHAYIVCQENNIPYMLTPHGNLNEYALSISKFKKFFFKKYFYSEIFDNAACIRALSFQEYLAIRKFGIKAPICIIPNSVISENNNLKLSKDSSFKKYFLNRKVFTYLGRLHSIKNIEGVIKAWSTSITFNNKEFSLIIAGEGSSDYTKSLKSLARSLNIENIIFLGGVWGLKKEFLLRESFFTILNSKSEALPMSILESLSYGTPVAISKFSGLSQKELKGSGFVYEGDDILSTLIDKISKLEVKEYRVMQLRALRLISISYSPEVVSQNIIDVYSWIEGDCPPPSTVIFD
jgi:glycosyltransferase involved in cell wall biosynthesis